jgi:hypothetical protein
MPKIDLYDYDEMDDLTTFEPIRKSAAPVDGHHDLQRRSENGLNRFRKQRQAKERAHMHSTRSDDE